MNAQELAYWQTQAAQEAEDDSRPTELDLLSFYDPQAYAQLAEIWDEQEAIYSASRGV